MKSTHKNIAVFVTHLGCPNMCVFCNQRTISGVCSFIKDDAKRVIDEALETLESGTECEIAFFGGSFTGIDRSLMIELLDLAQSYVNGGRVAGIRMSTRPDYINEEIIGILKRYTVSEIELGIQSLSDIVLEKCKRGHSVSQSKTAVRALVESGFSVVGQMMIGLPGATPDDETKCAEMICSLGASAARIYPTIVFKDTELYEMTLGGEYTPLTIEEAVRRSADVLRIFVKNGVECRRIGLCDSENLHTESTYFAGPNHPAMGELVCGELYFDVILDSLRREKIGKNKQVTVFVPRGDISLAVGQNKRNRLRIESELGIKNIKFKEKDGMKRYEIQLLLDEKSK